LGKGTVEVFVRDLQHEGRIYQRLKSLQGMVIPVYLGNIDLPKIYYLDVGVRIQHMMLMSWVGEEAKGSTALGHEYLKKQIQTSTEEIRRAGVMHGDVRSPNILWSQERQRVMLIDFERATTVLIGQFDGNEERDRGVLQRISPNRKRKFWHEAGSKEPGKFIQARAPA
jgi:tRNA A-37 threonylcarbamoyl transferase component Bud32